MHLHCKLPSYATVLSLSLTALKFNVEFSGPIPYLHQCDIEIFICIYALPSWLQKWSNNSFEYIQIFEHCWLWDVFYILDGQTPKSSRGQCSLQTLWFFFHYGITHHLQEGLLLILVTESLSGNSKRTIGVNVNLLSVKLVASHPAPSPSTDTAVFVLLNVRSLASKSLPCHDFTESQKLKFLMLTETWFSLFSTAKSARFLRWTSCVSLTEF